MQAFTFVGMPCRVIFGFGTISQVAEEMRTLGCSRALVLSGSHHAPTAQALVDQLGPLAVGLFCEAIVHTPIEVTERAVAAAKACAADCVVAVGGGAAVGLAKSIAYYTDLHQIVIPTTYSGSEGTPVIGQTKDGVKTTWRTVKVMAEVIIYDVDLTLSLSPQFTAASGLNALAHAMEGLYAVDANPIVSLIAEEGARAMARALPVLQRDPMDREARSDALYGAWACGSVMGAVSLGLQHKLSHTLGGAFDLPHAQTHAIMLPYTAAYNAPAAPEAMARLARALGVEDAPRGLYDLARTLGVPASLKEIGVPLDGLKRVADLAVAAPYPNPRPLTHEGIMGVLQAAYEGRRP